MYLRLKWTSGCNHPEKTVTIYDVVELFGTAVYGSMTPSNIWAAFKPAGIFPFNLDVFAEELYLCSLIKNRPNPREKDFLKKNENDPTPIKDTRDKIISVGLSVESSQKVPTATPNDSNTTSQPSTSRTSSITSNDALVCLGLLKASSRKKKEGVRPHRVHW